ncbi:MAG: hypothetical protein E6I80_19100 [Chloroflexi bacterium]|nr:MAG: hypothetical protein E6I80_19100 [Chloroflexota bacterium]
MNISRTLWRIQIVSVRNGARYDARMRFIFVLVTLFDMALGFWSGSQLLSHIEQWKASGPLALRWRPFYCRPPWWDWQLISS